jgi:hypothetical protein
MKRIITKAIFVFLFSCAFSKVNSQVQIVPAFHNLSFVMPTDIQNSGDGTNRIFVLEQKGVISVFPNDSNTTSKKTFLDITNKVLSGGEMGLLGLAFHPDYKHNGFFYIDYVADNPRRTVIARYTVSASDPDKADSNSELILLEVEQPYKNHKGGQTVFGPGGYLYIAFGDGGSGGDPQNHAQDRSVLLGKILRIDVNNKQGSLNYAIPPDNPFKGNTSGYREEIYSYGMRNPWRFSFDLPNGLLWAADVGQDLYEEIDLITKGGNYGWRCYEGFHEFNLSDCNGTDYIKPIWEYKHDMDGGDCITGGFVYRGHDALEFTGLYVYADYVVGKIWTLKLDGTTVKNSLRFQTKYAISTFGIDENKELYFTDYPNGMIYKFKDLPVNVK